MLSDTSIARLHAIVADAIDRVACSEQGPAAVKLYLAAIVDLWAFQKETGVNNFPTPRTTQASALIKALEKVKLQKDREHFVDRGRGTWISFHPEGPL